VPPSAELQSGLPTVLPGALLPALLERSHLSAALHAADVLSTCQLSAGHVSTVSRRVPQPAICALSLKNIIASGDSH
jgi:hypothetical protein